MFNEKLKKARLKAGISGRKAAELADISPAYYSQLETGARGVPTAEVQAKLEEALQIKFAKTMSLSDLPQDPDADPAMKSRLSEQQHVLTPRERVAQYAVIAYDDAKKNKKVGQFESLMQHLAGVITRNDSYEWHKKQLFNIIEEHFPKRTNEKETK